MTPYVNESIQAKKLLCLDNDPDILKMTQEILQSEFIPQKLEFFKAESGEKGLQMVEQLSPDIVLSEKGMPGIGGFEVCRKIHAGHPRTSVILTSTGQTGEDEAIQAYQSGADAFLSKPVTKGELLFAINLILRLSQLDETLSKKNKQLEDSLQREQSCQIDLSSLNHELLGDKKRLDSNLRELVDLNRRLEAKNTQVSSVMEELRSRFDSTVSLLTNIIELNRHENKGHAERVAETSVYIAIKLGLSSYQVDNIKTAARLHELGIVGLPTPETKQLALAEDVARVKSHHPLIGEMLLKGYPGFELIADMIRHLHENVDGTGSPDGFYGERIPIGSRIISISSFFDHERHAHLDRNHSEILKSMEEKTGTLFDHKVYRFLEEYVETLDQSPTQKTLECSVFALAPGMELASDMYSESGIHVLRTGTLLTEEVLGKIIKFHNVDPVIGPIKVRQE